MVLYEDNVTPQNDGRLLQNVNLFCHIPILVMVIPTAVYSDCQAARYAGHTTNGVYTIQHGQQTMKAYCDMDQAGKGYIVSTRLCILVQNVLYTL